MMESSASRPLLRRGGKSGARLGGGGSVVKLLAATAAVLAGCGVALVAVGGGRASDLVQVARPGGKLVRYMYVPAAVAEGRLPDGAPVPGLKVVKAYAGQKGVQRMIPINQLEMDPAQPAYLSVSVPLTTLAGNDTNATDGGGGNETEAAGGSEAGNELMKSRSCAISSLVEQAKAIFPEWNKCGYRGEWSSVANASDTPTGVISGPSDDAACGPDNIASFPCDQHYARKFKNNDPGMIRECYLRVWGMSQTCDMYDNCGGTLSKLSPHSSVCTGESTYYIEPEVQRMCGICSMFRAQVGGTATPDFDGSTPGWGCVASNSLIDVEKRGRVPISSITASDRILGTNRAARGGELGYDSVIFIHDHAMESATVVLGWNGGELELTGGHSLPVVKAGVGYTNVMAKDVALGDTILVQGESGGFEHRVVSGKRASSSLVRYIITEGDAFVASSALVSLYSTAAGAFETMPFRFINYILPGCLQWSPVASALRLALESPLLRLFEDGLLFLAASNTKAMTSTPRVGSAFGAVESLL